MHHGALKAHISYVHEGLKKGMSVKNRKNREKKNFAQLQHKLEPLP